ncbi:hypothetical protein HK096_010516, partial [Nowakowskiella sp. JEL0078]
MSRQTSLASSPSPIPAAAPASRKMDESLAKKKFEAMVEEFWSVRLVDEVVLSMKDVGRNFASVAVVTFLEKTMETKKDKVEEMAKLFVNLGSKGVLGTKDLKTGIDVPSIYKFYGIVLAILQNPTSPLLSFPHDINHVLAPVINVSGLNPPVGIVLAEMFETYVRIHANGNRTALANVYGDVDWAWYFSSVKGKTPDVAVQQWLAKVGYTWDIAPSVGIAEFAKRLSEDDVAAVITWMQNIPETVLGSVVSRGITMEVLKYVAKQTFMPAGPESLKKQSRELFSEIEIVVKRLVPVSQIAVKDVDSQVLVVATIDEYAGELEYPKDLLEHLLRIFTTTGIITREAQLKWKAGVEKTGSAKTLAAIKSINKYFQSIK